MLKIFSTLIFAILLSSGFASAVSAHGGEADGHSGTMMKMDDMMSEMMGENKAINCAAMDSAELIEEGEDLMSKMMAGDEAKHESMEESMEEIAGMEFHDMMHLMMWR